MPNVSLIRPMLPEIYLMHKKGRTVCVGAYLISSSYTVHLKTRGHPFKLYKERSYSSVRVSYLSVRVINVWNSLPADRVDFSSFAPFKQTIEQIDFSQFLFGYDN